MPKQEQQNKSGCLGVVVVLIVLVGGAAGVLHYLGKLQPLIDKARGAVSEAKEATPNTDPDHDPFKAASTTEPHSASSVPTATARTGSESVRAVTPTTPVAQENKYIAAYKARFKPPRVGSKIILTLKTGAKMTGTVEALTPSAVSIKRETYSVTLQRSQLAPVSRAMCWKEDYVKVMVAMRKKREAEQRAMDAYMAKLKADYLAQRERQNATLAHQRNNTSQARVKKVNVDNMDFKKYMETHGEPDLLKARKARIAAYEAQMRAAGREY